MREIPNTDGRYQLTEDGKVYKVIGTTRSGKTYDCMREVHSKYDRVSIYYNVDGELERKEHSVTKLMLEVYWDKILIDDPSRIFDNKHLRIHYIDGNNNNISVDNMMVTTGRKLDYNYLLYTPEDNRPHHREHYFRTLREIMLKFKVSKPQAVLLTKDTPYHVDGIYNESAYRIYIGEYANV